MTAAQAISAAGDLAGEVLQELEVGYTIKLIISQDRLRIFVQVEIDEPGYLCAAERVIKFVTDSRVFLTPEEKQRLPAVAALVTNGNQVPVLLAEGLAPRLPRRELLWQVNLEAEQPGARETVDHRDVTQFVRARAGQPLCELVVVAAEDGRDVFGDLLLCPPTAVADVSLPEAGPGVMLSPDGRTLLAQHDGCVQRVGGRLTVRRLYEVDGNLDFKVGNIDFDGRVTIKGDVLPGFQVKATGDVAITGMVENASIEAGQHLSIRGGVAGRGGTRLQAGGRVEARYLRAVGVESGEGVVVTAECVDAQIVCSGDVCVHKGAIIGGSVRAGGDVRANLLGSEMGVATSITAGHGGPVERALGEARAALTSLQSQVKNDEKALGLYRNPPGGVAALSPAKQKLIAVLEQTLADRERSVAAQRAKIEELLASYGQNSGRVIVGGRVYPNVTIRIGDLSRTITRPEDGPLEFYADLQKGMVEMVSSPATGAGEVGSRRP
jgi:uncharacterized protein (DUF342 family)